MFTLSPGADPHVNPSVIISFGNVSYDRLHPIVPDLVKCTHPSAREFIPLITRAEKIRARTAELRDALQQADYLKPEAP